jgi:hypothetical protein
VVTDDDWSPPDDWWDIMTTGENVYRVAQEDAEKVLAMMGRAEVGALYLGDVRMSGSRPRRRKKVYESSPA